MWYCDYSLDSVAATQGRKNLHTSGTVILQYDHTIKEEEKYGMKKQKLRIDDLQMKWCGVSSRDRWISTVINTFIFGFSLPQWTRSMHKEPVFVDENNWIYE